MPDDTDLTPGGPDDGHASDSAPGPAIGDGDPTGELEPVAVPEAATPLPEIPVGDLDAAEHPGIVADERRRGGTTMVLVQGLIGILVILAVALDPYAFTTIEELIGFGLVVFGALETYSLVRSRVRSWLYLQPIATIVAGTILIVWPRQTLTIAGFVLAAVIVLRGFQDVWGGARRWHEPGANSWVFIRGIILLVLGVIVVLFPTHSVVLVVVGGAAVAILRAAIAVGSIIVHRGETDTVDPSDTYGIIAAWLSQREMDAVAADEVEDRVFLHHGRRRERLSRFAVLMALATTIATFGIATDSTAVVIGAMLVAPLMTPILGVAAGLINGRTRSAALSATVVILGSAGAIFLAWLLSAVIPDLEAVVQNSQVTTRTAPSLLDLAIAIAAGAAGAYGVSRAESTDALPGVAVAIALVPPLAVVGITLHARDFGQAGGALLLFLTNLFSILLMAGVVFVLVGYGSWGRLYLRRNRIRVSFAAVVFAILLITIPLALTARDVFRESNALRNASMAVTEWLGEATTLRIEAISVTDDTVEVRLIGPDRPPTAESLGEDLTDRIGRPIGAIVRWTEETEDRSFLVRPDE